MQKNNIPKSRKRNARKKNNKNTSLSTLEKNVFAISIRKPIQYVDTISSVSGNKNIIFTTLGVQYFNLTNLVALADYTNLLGSYQMCRIRGLRLIVNRIIADNSLSAVYSNGVMPPLFIAYLPTQSSTTLSTVTAVESALKIDPFSVKAQSREWRLQPFQGNGVVESVSTAFDITQWFGTSGSTNLPGELVVSNSGNVNATNSTPLFSFTVEFDVEFCCPF
jgi:hypothetical protein